MQSQSLFLTSEFDKEFYENYSKFKHGSKTQARMFGKAVANVLSFGQQKSLIFYSAACNNVPTASNALMDYIISYTSPQIMESGISVRRGYINRKYSYDEDYGLMSKEERKSSIGNDVFHIDKSFINQEDTLVFVDDIKITGSHEDRVKELLKNNNITNDVIFIYIAIYNGEDPQIEHRLNHRLVNNLKDVNNIIRNEEFIFNIRVVKYILRADIDEFVSFITYQSDSFKQNLFSLSILNGYHTNPKYKTNFDILKNILNH